MAPSLFYLAVALTLLLGGLLVFLPWGSNWGSMAAERSSPMPGDAYLEGEPSARVTMTRAISIRAKRQIVWPWLAQLGRGAGWYSVDRLDNGGKDSARHIVSWVPVPKLGDASPIGYLRHIDSGRSLVWWADAVPFAGARARLVVDIRLTSQDRRSRLVIRMSADAKGTTAHVALLVFRFIDTIMARRQLLGIRERVEDYGARLANPELPETGARDQYQVYEVIYASGERAGRSGKDVPVRRQAAIADGVISPASGPERAGKQKSARYRSIQ